MFKKQKKRAFFFLPVSFLTSHGIVYLLFNVAFPQAQTYSLGECRLSPVPRAPPDDSMRTALIPDPALPMLAFRSPRGQRVVVVFGVEGSRLLRTHAREAGKRRDHLLAEAPKPPSVCVIVPQTSLTNSEIK